MVSAGVRDIKMHLSEYLRKVKMGEIVKITDRGVEIALVMPASSLGETTHINRTILNLVRKGIVTGFPGKPEGIKNPIKVKGKQISEIILSQR